ncbi:MAG: GH92 family glycosyl hydrolase [Terracidiphilus sp.]|nr:GH92 family glycosyl hydrolase [Terracidiphilus sp.]
MRPSVILFSALVLLFGSQIFEGQDPLRAVNLVAGTANEGQTAPMGGMPFAMTHWTPETRSTEEKCIAPYYYKDEAITGFRGSHWLSGSCALEYGSVTLMPVTGPIVVSPEARASAFRHETERMTPGYYSVQLDKYSERVEMTGSTRSGMMRITVPSGQEASILIEPNVHPGEGFVEIHTNQQEIVGYNPAHRFFSKPGLPAGISGFFVARFSTPFKGYGTWCGAKVSPGSELQNGGCNRLGAYATFDQRTRRVLVKIGTSFTSIEEARRNLDAEESGWNLERIRKKTEGAWRQRLGLIEIFGATPEQKQLFYTAIYHASLVPRIVNDADGTYNGFSDNAKLQKIERGDYYDDFSLWDTFRALHPLLTIIDPQREEQMVQSLVLKGEQGGYLPIFPLFNNYTSAMVGDHAGAVIADAYSKGLTHFDVEQAYRLMLQNATVIPPLEKYRDGAGRRALASYLKYGFIPLEDTVPDAYHHREQVSRTLEYAFDDSMVALMAHRLGKAEDVARMEAHAQYWRNVFDNKSGFVRGRHADGQWIEPFDAKSGASYVTEANPWQCTFFVPQDIPGLIEAIGGRSKFVSKLDGLFAEHLYDQGNEPSHHIAYLFDYAGAPSKTQHQVRSLLDSQYKVGPDGLPGNDDAGQMSAWYIFSAMGFYPVTPGIPEYAIGSPLFSKVVIHLPNGKRFVIRAEDQSRANEYIQDAHLNGRKFSAVILSHDEIAKGGMLTFRMGSRPSESIDVAH